MYCVPRVQCGVGCVGEVKDQCAFALVLPPYELASHARAPWIHDIGYQAWTEVAENRARLFLQFCTASVADLRLVRSYLTVHLRADVLFRSVICGATISPSEPQADFGKTPAAQVVSTHLLRGMYHSFPVSGVVS